MLHLMVHNAQQVTQQLQQIQSPLLHGCCLSLPISR